MIYLDLSRTSGLEHGVLQRLQIKGLVIAPWSVQRLSLGGNLFFLN